MYGDDGVVQPCDPTRTTVMSTASRLPTKVTSWLDALVARLHREDGAAIALAGALGMALGAAIGYSLQLNVIAQWHTAIARPGSSSTMSSALLVLPPSSSTNRVGRLRQLVLQPIGGALTAPTALVSPLPAHLHRGLLAPALLGFATGSATVISPPAGGLLAAVCALLAMHQLSEDRALVSLAAATTTTTRPAQTSSSSSAHSDNDNAVLILSPVTRGQRRHGGRDNSSDGSDNERCRPLQPMHDVHGLPSVHLHRARRHQRAPAALLLQRVSHSSQQRYYDVGSGSDAATAFARVPLPRSSSPPNSTT